MPHHSLCLNFGGGLAHVHYSTTDAVFRTISGQPIVMEFHKYLGPLFSLGDCTDWLPEEDSEESNNLWQQFNGWWEAKGREIYVPDK